MLAMLLIVVAVVAALRHHSLFLCSGKTSWTFPHDIAQWEGLGAKITPQALRDMDGGSHDSSAASHIIALTFTLRRLAQDVQSHRLLPHWGAHGRQQRPLHHPP